MQRKIDSKIHLTKPADHPECGRAECRLHTIDMSGQVECLMDAVKSKWSNPSVKNYCSDPSCKRFVDLLHPHPQPAADPA